MGGNLFIPELVMPEQVTERDNVDTAEKALMLAVFKDGLLAYAKNINATDPTGKLHYHEARIWIEDRDTEYPFSFENICAVLDIDTSYIRGKLKIYTDRVRRTKVSRKAFIADISARLRGDE